MSKFDLITCVLTAMLLVNVRNANSDWLMVLQKLDRMKSYLNHSKRFGEITPLNLYTFVLCVGAKVETYFARNQICSDFY